MQTYGNGYQPLKRVASAPLKRDHNYSNLNIEELIERAQEYLGPFGRTIANYGDIPEEQEEFIEWLNQVYDSVRLPEDVILSLEERRAAVVSLAGEERALIHREFYRERIREDDPEWYFTGKNKVFQRPITGKPWMCGWACNLDDSSNTHWLEARSGHGLEDGEDAYLLKTPSAAAVRLNVFSKNVAECEDAFSFMDSIPGDIIDVTVVRQTQELAPMDPSDPRFMTLLGTDTEAIDGYLVYENIGTAASPRRGDFKEFRDYTLTETGVDTFVYETEQSESDCHYWSKINTDNRFAEIQYQPDFDRWMFKVEPIYLGNFKAVPNGNGIFYDNWLGGEFTSVFEYNPFAENSTDDDVLYRYTLTVKPRSSVTSDDSSDDKVPSELPKLSEKVEDYINDENSEAFGRDWEGSGNDKIFRQYVEQLDLSETGDYREIIKFQGESEILNYDFLDGFEFFTRDTDFKENGGNHLLCGEIGSGKSIKFFKNINDGILTYDSVDAKGNMVLKLGSENAIKINYESNFSDTFVINLDDANTFGLSQISIDSDSYSKSDTKEYNGGVITLNTPWDIPTFQHGFKSVDGETCGQEGGFCPHQVIPTFPTVCFTWEDENYFAIGQIEIPTFFYSYTKDADKISTSIPRQEPEALDKVSESFEDGKDKFTYNVTYKKFAEPISIPTRKM